MRKKIAQKSRDMHGPRELNQITRDRNRVCDRLSMLR
jgi:hypothetical protein